MAGDQDFFALRGRDLREQWRASRADFEVAARRIEELTGTAGRRSGVPGPDADDSAADGDREGPRTGDA